MGASQALPLHRHRQSAKGNQGRRPAWERTVRLLYMPKTDLAFFAAIASLPTLPNQDLRLTRFEGLVCGRA